MKITAYAPILYGKEFLSWSIRSIIDYVDSYVVLYTKTGSHGTQTDEPCPDTYDELYQLARDAAGSKLTWINGTWKHEGEQRDSIFYYAGNSDLILPIDYDEIPEPGLVEMMIQQGYKSEARNFYVPMRHYWRSFHRCFLHDPAMPIRVINPRATEGYTTLNTDGKAYNHLGYAIRPELMRWKWLIHGHVNQLRKDCDWFNDRYMNKDAKTDLHPVGSDYWNYEIVNPIDYMPAFMADHPYFGREWIE